MEINSEELEQLRKESRKLRALEAAGVDNWEHYDDALTEIYKENEIDELINDAVFEVNELVSNADVSVENSINDSYVVTINESELKSILRELYCKFSAIE